MHTEVHVVREAAGSPCGRWPDGGGRRHLPPHRSPVVAHSHGRAALPPGRSVWWRWDVGKRDLGGMGLTHAARFVALHLPAVRISLSGRRTACTPGPNS
jgi:hypothetical protein